jgi:hypothetical protein
MQVQVTDIAFDCSLDDDDWSEQDQLETEEFLPSRYIGQIFELDLNNDADDADIAYELCEEIATQSGWLIREIDYRHILR